MKRGLSRHLTNYRFVCLTDDPAVEPYWRVPLQHDFPGWWSKLELFRPGLFSGPVLYLDLDTLITGDLSDIAGYRGPFAIARDFYQPTRGQSCVMAWTPNAETARIWARFMEDPKGHMRRIKATGDQAFINECLPNAVRLQDLFPDQIVSYKVHAQAGPPDGARLVCGHGEPRFSSPRAGWAHKAWRGLSTSPWKEWAA